MTGTIVWMTGLSGSGKSTLALGLEARLRAAGRPVYVVDGDELRLGLSSDLGFSPADRLENIRRAGELASILAHAGLVAIVALISPYRDGRDRARRVAQLTGHRFLEVYCAASLEVCEQRDPRRLYAKARAGLVADFTGISAPYEAPDFADLVLDTGTMSVGECVDLLEREIAARGLP